MKKMDKIKKFVKENKTWMIAGFAVGWIGMTVWEHKHTQPEATLLDTSESPWDILLDKPIADAFATVAYDDGEVGVIKDVVSVATRLAKQDFDSYKYTTILVDNLPDDKIEVVNAAYGMLIDAGLDAVLI